MKRGYIKKRKKRGTILIENIIFIILNLIYMTILIVFLLRYSSGTNLLEQSYSKQIALILDSAEPNMVIFLDMESAFEIAEEKLGKDNLNQVVNIQGNKVTVKLTKDSGYSYSFFNDINITGYYPSNTEEYKGYTFTIGGYNE